MVRWFSWNSAWSNAFTTVPWLDHPHSRDDKNNVQPVHLQMRRHLAYHNFVLKWLLIGVRHRTKLRCPWNSPDHSKASSSSWLFRIKKMWSPIPKRNAPKESPHNNQKIPKNQCTKIVPSWNDFKQCMFPKIISNKSSPTPTPPKPMPLAPFTLSWGIPSWKPSESTLGALHELTRSYGAGKRSNFWDHFGSRLLGRKPNIGPNLFWFYGDLALFLVGLLVKGPNILHSNGRYRFHFIYGNYFLLLIDICLHRQGEYDLSTH